MLYKTHIAGGLLAGAIVIKLNPTIDVYSIQTMGVLSLTSLGSVLPDIDHTGSFIGRKFKILSTIVSNVASHRGITHTPAFGALFSFALFKLANIIGFNIPSIYFIALFTGIMSHIILDALTVGGVPLLAPLSTKKISFTSFKTGSNFENILMIAMVFINIISFFNILRIY